MKNHLNIGFNAAFFHFAPGPGAEDGWNKTSDGRRRGSALTPTRSLPVNVHGAKLRPCSSRRGYVLQANIRILLGSAPSSLWSCSSRRWTRCCRQQGSKTKTGSKSPKMEFLCLLFWCLHVETEKRANFFVLGLSLNWRCILGIHHMSRSKNIKAPLKTCASIKTCVYIQAELVLSVIAASCLSPAPFGAKRALLFLVNDPGTWSRSCTLFV